MGEGGRVWERVGEGWERVGEGWERVGEGWERVGEGWERPGGDRRGLEEGGRGLGEGWERVGEGWERVGEVSGIWYLVGPPEAPTQPEGVPENAGLPTTTRRLTRSRQGGSKRAAHACTLRHQGLTPAVVSGWGGGGLCWFGGCAGCPGRRGRGCHTGAQYGTALGRCEARGRGSACGCAGGAAWSCTGV